MATFLHLTDLHLHEPEAEQARGDRAASARLAAILQQAAAGPHPDFVVISGDLADHGNRRAYELLAASLKGTSFPVLFAVGNHDDRAAFRAVFPDYAAGGPGDPVCVEAVCGDVHVVVLDTLVPGRTGGALGEAALAFLEAALARHPGLPKLLVLHHPPCNPGEEAPWDALTAHSTRALADRVKGSGVRAILCGHVHAHRLRTWCGVPLVTNCGLSSAIDPLSAQTLIVTEGASYGIGELSAEGLQYLFVPVDPPRRELARVPVAVLRGGT